MTKSSLKNMNNFLDSFIDAISAEKNASKNTIDSYSSDINNFLNYLSKNNLEIFSVNIKNISSYIEFLREKNLSERTLARKITSIKKFFLFLFDEKIIEKNPVTEIELPKFEIKLPKILSIENVNKIFNFLENGTSFEDLRNAIMIELLYAAGLRASELVSLKINNFPRNIKTDEFENYLIVSGKGGKERKIPLHEKSMSLLKKYLKIKCIFETNKIDSEKTNLKLFNEEKINSILKNKDNKNECSNNFEKNFKIKNDKNNFKNSKIKFENNIKKLDMNFLFPSNSKSGHISRQRLGHILKKVGENVGIPLNKISPHVLRHAFATHMLENGANILAIKKLLGHKDISTTEIYTHLAPWHVMELVKKHHPLSGNYSAKKSSNIRNKKQN